MSAPVLTVPTHQDGMIENGSPQYETGEICIWITAPQTHSTEQPFPPPCTVVWCIQWEMVNCIWTESSTSIQEKLARKASKFR
jgi:hypothetical protein